MKLARDSWLLFAVPAGVLLAGGWWIVGGSGSLNHGDTVRFRLAEGEKSADAAVRPSAVARAESEGATSRSDDGADVDEVGVTCTGEAPDVPLAVWSGKVLSRNGIPIEGAVVNIHGFRNLRLGNSAVFEEETFQVVIGPDGILEFEMKPGWVYEIEAKAKGYGVEKYVVQGPTGQDLVLDKASDLTGRVLDKTTGLPLAGARVVFENGYETYEVRTDSDGNFRFEGVGARSAQVFISDNAHVAVGQPIDFLRPGEASQLDVFVNEGMHLGGQVLIAGSQNPAANMQVELLDRFTHQVVSTGFTDGAGRFSFRSLSAFRDYIVSAFGAGYSTDSLPQTFHSNDSITLTVTPTWTLTVGVRSGAAGIPGAQIVLMRQDGLPLPGFGSQTTVAALANPQGYAAFGGLSRELAYRIVVNHPGYATMELTSLTSISSPELFVYADLLPARMLQGTVVDQMNQPVAGVTVRVQRVDNVPAPALFTMADADGAFTFDSVAAGFVSLVTFKAGYDNTRVVVEIPAGGEPAPVQLVIEPLVTAPSSGGLAGTLGGSLGNK